MKDRGDAWLELTCVRENAVDLHNRDMCVPRLCGNPSLKALPGFVAECE